MLKYEVILSKNAEKLLRKIKDNRELKMILANLKKLESEPEKPGKALVQDLKGDKKDIYEITKKMISEVDNNDF